MGWVKRILNTATKDWKNANAQWKDIKKIQKIEEGEKVLPPKHPREVEAFKKAADDPKLKELVDKKDETLIENVNKIKIESTDPPERWTSTKQLPSRESEFEHRNDPVWQYGFYEPPLEKMEPNRIMFREALDVLRSRMEFETPGPDGQRRPMADEAFQKYNAHPAVQRIDKEKLDNMFQYFRPFERNDTQRVVRRQDLEQLEDILEGRVDIRAPEYAPVIEAMKKKKNYLQLKAKFGRQLEQHEEQQKKLEGIQKKYIEELKDEQQKKLEGIQKKFVEELKEEEEKESKKK